MLGKSATPAATLEAPTERVPPRRTSAQRLTTNSGMAINSEMGEPRFESLTKFCMEVKCNQEQSFHDPDRRPHGLRKHSSK